MGKPGRQAAVRGGGSLESGIPLRGELAAGGPGGGGGAYRAKLAPATAAEQGVLRPPTCFIVGAAPVSGRAAGRGRGEGGVLSECASSRWCQRACKLVSVADILIRTSDAD